MNFSIRLAFYISFSMENKFFHFINEQLKESF